MPSAATLRPNSQTPLSISGWLIATFVALPSCMNSSQATRPTTLGTNEDQTSLLSPDVEPDNPPEHANFPKQLQEKIHQLSQSATAVPTEIALLPVPVNQQSNTGPLFEALLSLNMNAKMGSVADWSVHHYKHCEQQPSHPLLDMHASRGIDPTLVHQQLAAVRQELAKLEERLGHANEWTLEMNSLTNECEAIVSLIMVTCAKSMVSSS